MKISTETNRNLVLFLIYCLALNCVPIFVEKNFALPVFKTQDKQHLIRVDASRIKNAETKKIIANTVKESPFAVKEIDNAGSWNLRFRSDAKDANKILVEREGETLIKEISLSEDNFSNQVAEFIRREYRWQSLRYLENENTNANVSVELKVVPIKNPRIEDGRLKFDEETADNVAREQLKEGDYFVFEIKNTGKIPAYVTIFDLDSGGVVKILFPVSERGEAFAPGKIWRTNEVYRITPPFGLEVYKAFATDKPLNLKVFEQELKDAEIANLYTDKFFKNANVKWATASLRFQIGDNKPPILYQIAIGINQAAKDALTVLEALEKNTNFAKTEKIALTDKLADQRQIQNSFENIIAKAKPEDAFVFYFAGNVAQTDNSLFNLMIDGTAQNQISGSLLQTWLDKIRAKQQILIFDSQTDSNTFGAIAEQFREDSKARQKLLDKQRIVWTSISNVAKDDKPSILATAVSESFSGDAEVDATGDGFISVFELESYLSRKSLELSRGRQRLGNFSNGEDFNIAVSNKKENAEQKRTSVVVVSESDSKSKTQLGKSYALIFATNEYENYNPLRNPLNDAEDLGKTLREDYGFEVDIRPNLKLEDVFNTLLEYQEKRKFAQGDQLLIFFAGHGTFKPKPDDMGYIIAKDSPLNGVPLRIYLSFSDLAKMVNSIDCRHILLILDVCQGGYFGQVGRRNIGDGDGDGDYRKISADELISKVIGRKSRKYITSAGLEYASDGSRRNSPFAYRLLEILRKDALKDENGLLTFDEIAAGVKNIAGQTPFSGEFLDNEPGSDFFFRVKK